MLIDISVRTYPTEIAEGFNTYLSSIAQKLLPKCTPSTGHFSDYVSEHVNPNFIFDSADPVEVICISDSLDPGTGSGSYSIPSDILKALNANLFLALTTIINMSFAAGIYPDLFKIAKVIPIFKKEDSCCLTRGLSHYPLTSTKRLKNWYIQGYKNFSNFTTTYMTPNLVSELKIQLNLP